MALDAIAYGSLTIIVVITVFGIQATGNRLERKINRIERYLDLILDRMEIEVPSQLSEQVRQIAIDPARKIEAIKRYRQETGAGLVEAKEAIEAFMEGDRPR